MGVKSTGFRELTARLTVQSRELLPRVEEITRDAVEQGATLQRELLDKATTPYGALRLSRGQGNSAGRNDQGDLIADVESTVSATDRRVQGSWGWRNPTGKEYAQELGGSPTNIRAAHSLLDSFTIVRQVWESRMRKLVR